MIHTSSDIVFFLKQRGIFVSEKDMEIIWHTDDPEAVKKINWIDNNMRSRCLPSILINLKKICILIKKNKTSNTAKGTSETRGQKPQKI